MPTKRRRRRRANVAGPEKELQEYLLEGDPRSPVRFFSSREKLSAAWDGMRDRVVDDWIRRRPGTRPWAWWHFDAPEEAGELAQGLAPDVDPTTGIPSAKAQVVVLRRLGILEPSEVRRCGRRG